MTKSGPTKSKFLKPGYTFSWFKQQSLASNLHLFHILLTETYSQTTNSQKTFFLMLVESSA